MKTNRCLAAISLSLVLLTLPAASKPKDVEGEIRLLARQVAEIAGKQRGLLDQVELLKRQVRLDEAVLARLHDRQSRTQKELAATNDELQSLSDKEAGVSVYLRQRMRQQYALGVLQEYRIYFSVSSTQDLRTAGMYLQALARKDAASLKELHALRVEKQKTAERLNDLKEQLDNQSTEAAKEKDNLLREQRRFAGMLSDLEKKRHTAQQALDETIEAAKKMDRYVSDLAFRSRVDLYSKNMSDSEGSLPFPCRGRITRGFGDYVNPRFLTRVPHPGLDISAPLGTPVKAVFDGMVEYADWLSGYGYTVILRHPGGYFTIYAHLDRVTARKGEAISQGQEVGTVGENATTASTGLYFELREGGKAINPLPWLKGVSHGK
jgi:septal ring factor EnvC (AmiA/AmiB activator)